ncbi:hypothetical protein IFM89_038968 [Coptis chinensis]|uniref:Endonuclease/exonuclease/phosphatase domain-containing protein n=1 Tax=Coptis chinensis TaxID=261450 RepID=A0A835IX24_9MAGN|nr:hypothetical protein IFM89_038968 [Coptis chinensis]
MLLLKGGLTARLRVSTDFARRYALRCIGRNETIFGIYRCCLSKSMSVITMSSSGPPKFKPLDKYAKQNDNGNKFRIVSYNILAQVFVKSSYFPHSPSPCLRWKARSQAVLTVLKSLESDFLCLQELDEYDCFYKEKLETDGYSSIYVQRSGQKRDGCGIFYKPNSAELLLEEKIEYNDLVDGISSCVSEHDVTQVTGNGDDVPIEGAPLKKDPRDRGDPNDPRVRLKRDCVGIMGAFKLKDLHVIVVNTHLYWDPELADVKLEQAKYLLLRLAQFKAIVANKLGCNASIVVCGDFNSTPGDQVYQYLVSGYSSSIPHDNAEDLPIPLCSVYAYDTGKEPPFTNCTPMFTNTLDYIFFSPSEQLEPVAVLELPEPESSEVAGGLPNYHHPSDHLPIGAEFVIRASS